MRRRKIFDLQDRELAITATCARVPVIHCHSESIRIRTRELVSVEQCRALLAAAEGVELVDDPGQGIYPLNVDATDRDEVFVGRIRADPGPQRGNYLNIWVVGDNLRKGAATNAVQIAELLCERGCASAQERRARQPLHA